VGFKAKQEGRDQLGCAFHFELALRSFHLSIRLPSPRMLANKRLGREEYEKREPDTTGHHSIQEAEPDSLVSCESETYATVSTVD
jgi:hypothetical protein